MSYKTDKIDEKVAEIIKNGGVGLLPSDTIYGLSCAALDEQAVEKIRNLKKRDSNKPLIVLISDLKMLNLLSISADQAKLAKPYWPGALSLEFYAPGSPSWLHRGLNHFAVRMPSFPNLLKLIDKAGPIISTSANLQGEEPIKSPDKAEGIFGDQLDFYVDAGVLDNPPSTLAVIENQKLKVVRQGAVKID